MSDDISKNDRNWLILIAALILLLIIVITYQFWPSALRLFNWPG